VDGVQAAIPSIFGVTPPAIERRHSLNFACAARSWVKEEVRCSSSSSSCFLTCESCCVERDARSTCIDVSYIANFGEEEGRSGYYWFGLLGKTLLWLCAGSEEGGVEVRQKIWFWSLDNNLMSRARGSTEIYLCTPPTTVTIWHILIP
jgi:hypothetical protein